MDVLKIIVIIAFLFMLVNTIKPIIGSLSRKRAGLYAGFWLVLYLLVWVAPGLMAPSNETSAGSEGEADQEVQKHDAEVPHEVKEEEAMVEETIDFDPETIELTMDVPNLLGLTREEFLANFDKDLEHNKENPMLMTFENGEVLFKNNVASSITYYPEGLKYPEDNRLLLASLGFDIKELKKGSNPFEDPITFYLIGGFSDVTISAVDNEGQGRPIEKVYIKKEIYPSTLEQDEENEEE